ncbi:folate receptor alpha-like [Daphnia pulex]|uniref:folate receptor alpha-like n=1 Tax=Daphnia pulex TaxID=6669 RepID=UPI001EDDFDF5|nr:folate receptor alpha-like [Daphnia pulex]
MLSHHQNACETRHYVIFVLLFLGLFHSISGQISVKDKRQLVNSCIDGNNHKREPGPEDSLHKQCLPWKNNSCCTGNTTVHAHGGKMYGFNYNHCPNRKMSSKCLEHFVQDLCFYECSPNVGPWMQTVNMKMRRERFLDVPLCATDCDDWFNACKDDYTCTDNWTLNFKWINGTNHCRPESECRTFSDIFQNSSNFCERVWDHSWKYTNNSEPCMRIWFDGDQGNPNENIARWKIQQSNSAETFSTKPLTYVLPALMLFLNY